MMDDLRIGAAGWSAPNAAAQPFPDERSHLARYSQVLSCAEIYGSRGARSLLTPPSSTLAPVKAAAAAKAKPSRKKTA